jgi:signal transduction histidine kinase
LKKLFQAESIKKANAFSISLVAVLTIFVLIFIIYTLHKENSVNIENIEKEYIQTQKELIKHETNRALKYIAFKHQKDGETKPLKEIQSDIVDAIEQMRNERDGTGYIFIYTFDGVNIADPILKENAGKNLLNMKDPNGKRVIYELIKVSKEDDGGFVEYVWNKPVTNKLAPKVSYAISYKPWGWMIGSGVYLDDIHKAVKEKEFAAKNRISKYIVGILSLSMLLFMIGMAIYRYFSMTVSDDINYIQERLQLVSTNYEKINPKNLRYTEFNKIANYINSMVEEIIAKNIALEDLNKNLEERVEQKTQRLNSAKEFAESVALKQDKFIKNATHEINTPLSIILTNIDLYNMNNSKNRHITKVEAGVKIIHNIYNDLSYITKKDRIEYKKSVINFSNFLEERVEFFNEVALGNQIGLNSQIEPNLRVFFNEIELQRVCDNNISNAIKYSKTGKNVTVKLYEDKKDILFEVISQGESIANPDKLFDRFYREANARGGFGIGLNIVKEICGKYGVLIEVISQNSQNSFKYTFRKHDENTIA